MQYLGIGSALGRRRQASARHFFLSTARALRCWLPILLSGATILSLTDASALAQGDEPRCAVIELYVGDDAELDKAVTETMEKFVKTRTNVFIRQYDIQEEPSQERLGKVLKYFNIEKAQTPVAYTCGTLLLNNQDQKRLTLRVNNALTVHTFVRAGCPHCAAAKQFLAKMEPKYPCFRFVFHEVVGNEKARQQLQDLSNHYKKSASSLPAFYYCNQLSFGFDTESTSGPRVEGIMRKWTLNCPKKQSSLFKKRVDVADNRLQHATSQVFFAVADPPAEEEADDLVLPETDIVLPETDDQPLPAADPQSDLPLLPGAGGEDVPPPLPPEEAAAPPLPDADLGPILPEGAEPLPEDTVEQDTMTVPLLGTLRLSQLGMPLFTILIGLVDGFNPCAMWVLIFLLSLLVNLKSRAKILAVAGTFVVISGLAYYAFMAAWLNVFLFIGFLVPVQIALGLIGLTVGCIHIKDFFAFKKGVSLSIPESAKPTIYARSRQIVNAKSLLTAIVCASVLAVMVNIVELLCTAGLPALYTNILMAQNYPAWENYAYLGLYILAYMFDDSLMVGIVVVTLGRRKMQEKEGRWLKLISGIVIVVLGIYMIFDATRTYMASSDDQPVIEETQEPLDEEPQIIIESAT